MSETLGSPQNGDQPPKFDPKNPFTWPEEPSVQPPDQVPGLLDRRLLTREEERRKKINSVCKRFYTKFKKAIFCQNKVCKTESTFGRFSYGRSRCFYVGGI